MYEEALAFGLLLTAGQRIFELRLSKRHEAFLRRRGAVEYGRRHYRLLVAVHASWFGSMGLEAALGPRTFSPVWPLLLAAWILAEAVRGWVMRTLGRSWCTRILVVPGGRAVREGPYRFLRHPNYLVVVMEIALIPAIFGLYRTAAVFSLLNAAVLAVRIREENRALREVYR